MKNQFYFRDFINGAQFRLSIILFYFFPFFFFSWFPQWILWLCLLFPLRWIRALPISLSWSHSALCEWHIQTWRTGIWLWWRSVGATGDLFCCCRAKLLFLFPHVMFLQTLHMGIRPEYIHLSSDGIYIRMTNLFLSPDEGLGLHVKMQVKSERQWFVAKLRISSPSCSLFLKTHTATCLALSPIFRFWGKGTWKWRIT